MKQTVFEQIRERIAHNEVNNSGKHFFIYQTTPQYPTGVLKFFVDNKILEIKNVQKSYNNGFEFKVEYKNLNENKRFVAKAIKNYEYEQYKQELKQREADIKAMRFREELECPNWSNIADETGYMACPNNTGGYEMIEPQDSCMTDLVLQELGYECYDDFVSDNANVPLQELKTQMYEQLRAFEEFCAKEYEI